MFLKLVPRFLKTVNKRSLFYFTYNLGWKGICSVYKFKKRISQNKYFPAFLFVSVTNKCNLSCLGCWVEKTSPPVSLDIKLLHHIINESKKMGVYFFGILGGEPLLYDGLYEIFNSHRDCYFLLFTNGTHIDESVAEKLQNAGNVSPLISVEGDSLTSDIRRNGENIYEKTINGLDQCLSKKIVTGVATSVCKTNINELVNDGFLDSLIERGVHYVWYYIYRPVGSSPHPELALSKEEILTLRKFMLHARKTKPIVIVDAYWDHLGRGICPAASGIGLHINAAGQIEPCPVVQLSSDSVSAERSLVDQINSSFYLKTFRKKVGKKTNGCIILDDPKYLASFSRECNASDSSFRNTMYCELLDMNKCPSHDLKEEAIAETHWFYKFAKKNSFFGLGAYG